MIRLVVRVVVLGFVIGTVATIVAAVRIRSRFTPITDPTADDIALFGLFSSVGFASRATQFRGGVVELWYAGAVIDLRGATLAPEGATLRIRNVFAGGQLIAPESWRVVVQTQGMAGVDDGADSFSQDPDAPTLNVEFVNLFGGFQITSELSAEAEQQLHQAIADA
jgi:hypothetical protein